MSQKNEARKKYLQVKNIATREIYEMKTTEANRIRREKKIIWTNNKIRQIEEASNKSDSKKFVKEVKFFNKQKSV